jgi:PAS domain S-box-containing protein
MSSGSRYINIKDYRVLKLILATLLFIPVCLTCTYDLCAQRFNFNVYTISDGLPGNQINEVIQDRYGRLWVGTMNGVAIYDGKRFTGFEKTNPISGNPVKTIYEDSKGNIWIGMIRKGVCKFTGTSFEFYNTGNGLLSDNVNAVIEDKRGNIWIGTSEGLNRFDGKMMHSYTTLRGLVDNNVFSLMVDEKGLLWIATIGGISTFDGKDFKNFTTADGLVSNICYHLHQSQPYQVWISTYLGISLYDGTRFQNFSSSNGILTERIEKIIETSDRKKIFASYGGGVGVIENDSISYITVEDGLPSNIVKTVFKDREGNFWFGTWSGLCKFNGHRFISYTHEDGLANNNILCLSSDTSGRVFFGTLTGGISFYENGSIVSLGSESGLKGLTIWSIYINNNEYWLGTTNGPALLNPKTRQVVHPYHFFDNLIIYTIIRDRKGRLMMGTDKGVYIQESPTTFRQLSRDEGLVNNKVRVLYEDRSGRVWIGSMKSIYYLENDSLHSFTDRFQIPDAPVTSIIQDTTGRILVSTYDFGIYIIGDGASSDIIKPINKSNGLLTDRILFNYLDQNQNLWLGTSSGLDVIRWRHFLSTGRIELFHFDKSNGYSGVETNAAIEDNLGNIWFASVNGAIKHTLKTGFQEQTIPLLRISQIELFLKQVDWRKKQIGINPRTGLPESMILSHDNNHISIHYSGIYLTAPEEVRYQYILEGFSEEWAPVTTQTFANYSNLDPGEYTFKVKATVNGRQWSNPVTYSFTIKPPYWKTPFFYFLYTMAASSSLFLFLRIRTQNLQRSQNVLRQKVEQRTRELHLKNAELEKLSIVASGTDNAVLIFDESGNIEWANAGYTKMTGYTVDELRSSRGTSISDFTFSNEVTNLLNKELSTGTSSIFESQIRCKDGSLKWVSNTLNPIRNQSGEVKRIVVIETDITYRKMMEEQIRESLEEKGLLLREIHHRVKNNLQIIISLFNLQSHYVSDQRAFEALKEGQDRIKSMALIHERFYQSEGLSRIDFDEYIKRLIENLFLSFNTGQEQVEFEVDADKISLDIDTAVPCGLIINELVSNTLKHAFPNGNKGMLRVSFRKNSDQTLRLVVSDNGIGLPEGFSIEDSDSLGMQLINALTNQLDARITVGNGTGATFTLEFKPAH